MIGKLIVIGFATFLLLSSIQANILRCDLIDPHSNEAELCWLQLFQKNPSLTMQVIEEIPPEEPSIGARNAEISSALMGLFKPTGKRNPDIPKELLQLIGDIRPYKEN